HLTWGKQADTCILCWPMMIVDAAKLQYNLKPHESAKFIDKNGRIVMIMMRGFCTCAKLVSWINLIILKNVSIKKNVRVQKFVKQ
ncbi:hypothetical protein GYMLUDRAFT_175797, partial [Collybiopsis luxurians FD-317 M1]